MLILLARLRPVAFFALLFCVAWDDAAFGEALEAPSAQKKTVLVLYGERLSIPAMRMTEQGLMSGLLSAHARDVEVFSENLDLTRFPAARNGDDLVRYLRSRYGMRKPDVLIALVDNALQFVLDHRDELFQGVPIVFADVDHREVEGKEMPPNVTGLWMEWDYQRTLELALQLQPETREVVCVAGTGVEEQSWNNEARKVLERFATRVRTRWLDKLPLQTVLDVVARLPLNSVVLYIPMLRDGAGQSVSPYQVAQQLAEASRVPVYGLSRPELDQGIIGGALLDFSEIGGKTARLALRVLAGERLPLLSSPDPSTNPLLINWPALKKWHVSESRIPGEATVLYREPSLWEQHPRLILATAAVVGLQSLFIVGLIIQRSRMKRAEASLRESEARFRIMANTAPVMIWMSGVDKLCNFFNKGWLDFTDRSLEQELGNGWAEGVHREDLDRCLEVYVNSFDARQLFTMEYRLRRSDGEYRWVLDTGAPRFAPDGTLLGYIGSCVDITERKQAEDRFRLVVEASPNGIVLVTAQGHIVLVNTRVENLFGYRRGELIGQGIELLVPERFRGEHPAHRAGFHAAPAARAMGAGLELFARRKDGTEFPVEIGLSPIQSSEGMLILSVIVDISTRKRAEAEARQLRDELTHLSRVTILGEMATTLAHELNQPLGAIHSYAEAAELFLQKNPPDLNLLREILGHIRHDAWRTGEVIHRMRSLLRRRPFKMDRIEVKGLVEALGGLLQSAVISRKARLRIDVAPALPPVWGDAVQLQQVLLNLIVNALDAVVDRPAEEREVLVRALPSATWGVEMRVTDRGPGFSKETLARLFEPFFSTKKHGMGIGLRICRTIIEAHGGQLTAENNPGRGTTMRFTLPANPHEEEKSA